jgi:hypothetical protein
MSRNRRAFRLRRNVIMREPARPKDPWPGPRRGRDGRGAAMGPSARGSPCRRRLGATGEAGSAGPPAIVMNGCRPDFHAVRTLAAPPRRGPRVAFAGGGMLACIPPATPRQAVMRQRAAHPPPAMSNRFSTVVRRSAVALRRLAEGPGDGGSREPMAPAPPTPAGMPAPPRGCGGSAAETGAEGRRACLTT